jgi:hypothetical protein
MSENFATLEKTCKTMLDSLLAGSRHTLCLNIAEPGFSAAQVAVDYLKAQGKEVGTINEPNALQFATMLEGISGKTILVNFEDLDKHPNCISVLLEHVQKKDVDGKLIVVSQHWNSDNTQKELELRKHCLFYQQNTAAPPSKKKQ